MLQSEPMSELRDYLNLGLGVLKEKGAVPVALSGTAHSFNVLIQEIATASREREDWTPSDDEECYVFIDKDDEAAAGAKPHRGQSFYRAETGLYYEIMETHNKGPYLASRYRCRIVQEITA